MLEINYYQWLDGDNCCQQTRGCGCEDNPCDCDAILLELSKLHTDDLILQDLIDDLSGKTSGGCDCDFEDYYTKEEIDDKNYINQIKTINGQSLSGTGDVIVGTGGTIAVDDALSTTSENPVQNKVIANAFYTKQQSDSYYQPKGNYLTKASGDTLYQPVGNYLTKSTADGYYQPIGNYLTKIVGDTYYQPIGDYVTNAKITQYIANLQEQIDSLKAQVSGCCGETGETYYRWVTMTGANDYWCDSTTKMSKEKQQMSTDGITWTDTGVVRSGSTVLEENSTDCGYVPPTPPTPTGDKFKLWYSDGNIYTKECDSSPVITTAETRAEYDYTNVNQIAIGECPTEIGYHAFAYMEKVLSVTIPSNITSIGSSAFYDCHGLRTVELTSGLTAIEYGAFHGCDLLSGITIPDTVTSIGALAFWDCSGLTSVEIGSGVTSIGGSAFQGCKGLTNVTIPNSVTSIGNSAFKGCTGLTDITMGNNVTSIGDEAFSNCLNLTGVTIPSGVTSIGHGAFILCSGLTSVEIPSGVTIIRNNTFQNCVSLSSVTIPNLVTHIENSAFNSCSSLTSVTIPSSVTSMGNNVFQGCSGLTSITIEATTPPTIGTDVFKNSTCPIYVPAASLGAYQTASGWSTYASRLQAIQ